MVAITARVQNLHRNLATLGVYGIGYLLVAACRTCVGQHTGKRLSPARDVGRKPVRDHQPDTAACPLCKIRRHCWEMLAPIFHPVCMLPIKTRFLSVVKPRSSGARR